MKWLLLIVFPFLVMATAEVIKRLSTRATAAEQLIQLLKKQIEEVKLSQGASGNYAQEIQKLKLENAQLKTQVEEWKGKLEAAEGASGVQQVSVKVPQAQAQAQAQEKQKSPSPPQSQEQVKEKKEKPKKEKAEKPANKVGGDRKSTR